jgi:hypothetical protein
MAIAWSKVFSFLGQHAASGLSAVGAAQAAGIQMSTKEMAAIFASAAIAGSVNHTRETATMTKPEAPPVDVPVAVIVPDPPSAPVLTLEQRFEDRLGDIYAEEGIQIPGKDGPGMTERREGYKLLEAGREDELRKNLRGRK